MTTSSGVARSLEERLIHLPMHIYQYQNVNIRFEGYSMAEKLTYRASGIPHPVDAHVGSRIELARKLKRMSQSDLANAVGVSFQQVQKYERGTNRVSASALFAIMQALNLTASYFFEGLASEYIGENATASDAELIPSEVSAFMGSRHGIQLIQNYLSAPAGVQKALAALLSEIP